ncbi:MAG: CapA family protein, partial [Clostridia bacterium]|nr:CapA family protein [Clostridia bacterium]
MKIYKFLPLLLAVLLLVGCVQTKEETIEEIEAEVEAEILAPTEEVSEPESAPEEEPESEAENIVLKLTAVGDNLVHNTLSFDSRQSDGSYDFRPIYSGVAHKIEGSDIAIVNQEVPLDGTAGSYPTLSAPFEVADALKELGFNAATLANNHMADKGADGLRLTLEALQARGFATAGAHAADAPNYAIMEARGIRIGLLSYTYGTNGGTPSGWAIDRIGTDRITSDVQALRPQCDFLVVAMHWGEEYQTTPSEGQQEFAHLLADLDVDLILGSHPHVMQPAQWLTQPDGGDTLCIYSLGNFTCDQRDQDRLIGALLTCRLTFAP